MKAFFKTYRVYIGLFVLLWVVLSITQFWVIRPIREDSKRQKTEIKNLEKENKHINDKLKANDLLISSKNRQIETLEALEDHYKNQVIKIDISYEKQKTSYIGRPVAERRRIFAKLANE